MDPIIESAVAWHDVGEPDDFPDGAAWPVAVSYTHLTLPTSDLV